MAYWCFDFRFLNPGTPSPEELVSYFLELEYSGVVLSFNATQEQNVLELLRSQEVRELLELLESQGIKVYFMAIAEAKNLKRYSSLSKYGIILGAEGGNKKKNLKLISNYSLDVLLNPSKDVKLKDYLHNVSSGIDDKLLNALRNRALFFAIPYSRIFEFSKYYQALIIRQIIQELRLLRKKQVPTILAFSHNDPRKLRDPEDIITLLEVFGKEHELSYEWLEKLISEYPAKLIELKRHLLPGLQVLDLVDESTD